MYTSSQGHVPGIEQTAEQVYIYVVQVGITVPYLILCSSGSWVFNSTSDAHIWNLNSSVGRQNAASSP